MENRAYSYIEPHAVRTITVVGAGTVGRSWVAMFLAGGFRVIVVDPNVPHDDIKAFVMASWPILRLQFPNIRIDPCFDELVAADDLREAVAQADLVHENTLEQPEFKRKMVGDIDAVLPKDRLILSTSGGIPPTFIQSDCRFPDRVVVAHPFHPAHIVQLVEIVAGEKTSRAAVEWTREFMVQLGKRPILLQKEVIGHLGNRLQAALLQEAFHCIAQGIASARDIDDAVRYGLGPRWALLGPLLTFHLAGGAGGAAHTFELAADAFQRWWADLGRVRLTKEVQEQIIAAISDMASHQSIDEWISWRDRHLVELKQHLQNIDERSSSA